MKLKNYGALLSPLMVIAFVMTAHAVPDARGSTRHDIATVKYEKHADVAILAYTDFVKTETPNIRPPDFAEASAFYFEVQRIGYPRPVDEKVPLKWKNKKSSVVAHRCREDTHAAY